MLQQISPEVTAIHLQHFGSIVYLLKLQTTNQQLQTILIDVSSKENTQELISSLKQLNLKPQDINTIILTHAHYDHMQNINLFPNAKIYGNFTHIINKDHSQTRIGQPSTVYSQQTILPISDCPIVGMSDCQIILAPGHTEGDILILYKNILFSGDVIFHGGYIGRNDFPESNPEVQKKSLQMLSKIKFDILCPGH